jgi:hypothetical protein
MSTAVNRSPNKLWGSNSIFNHKPSKIASHKEVSKQLKLPDPLDPDPAPEQLILGYSRSKFYTKTMIIW